MQDRGTEIEARDRRDSIGQKAKVPAARQQPAKLHTAEKEPAHATKTEAILEAGPQNIEKTTLHQTCREKVGPPKELHQR